MGDGKAALVAVLAVAAGFVVGFLWGRGTRQAGPGVTSTEFAHGVLTVRVGVRDALVDGFKSIAPQLLEFL